VLVARQECPQPTAPATPTQSKEQRRAGRKPVRLKGQVADGRQQTYACTVIDMSAMGAMLQVHSYESRRHGGAIQIPPHFFLVVENLIERSVVECKVVWQIDGRAGVQFIGPIDSTVKKLPARKPSDKPKQASLRRC
jgi:hypothetical protein